VKSVIEAHHGSVRLADSGAFGTGGATFVIDLPAEETA
jgi:signal transduction histidine kinase